MKKRIIILVMILLLTTGCTCEYNLTIENNVYKEEIVIGAETSNEKANFSNEWIIEVNKEEYELPKETIVKKNGNYYYDYQVEENNLVFNYDFTRSELVNSTAISRCYDSVSITNQDNKIIISTSQDVKCYNLYPTLSNLKINIKTDLKSTSNNADSVKNNIYTWNITSSNANNKPINIVLEKANPSSSVEPINKNSNKNDYTLYIFSAILLLVMLTGYFIFNKLKSKHSINEDD